MPHLIAALRRPSPILMLYLLVLPAALSAQTGLGDVSPASVPSGTHIRFELPSAGATGLVNAEIVRRSQDLRPPAFSASFARLPDSSVRRQAELEHIPWAGPAIDRIRQHLRTHPQLTRVLKLVAPR